MVKVKILKNKRNNQFFVALPKKKLKSLMGKNKNPQFLNIEDEDII